MAITALPPAPSRQNPANFADEADAFVDALALFQSEANALQTDVNTKQGLAATSESNAAASASSASTSASAAAISATTAAGAAGAPLWVTSTNYAQYAAVTSPSTFYAYRAKVALNPSTIDPASDPTNWQLLNDVTFVQVVAGTSVSALVGGHYILTNVALTTVTLPAAAQSGNEIWVTVANDLETNVVARNGLIIMGLAENLTIDMKYVTLRLRYVNSSWRLV